MLDPRQRDYAIRTIYGEAANDPSAEAVAHVIRNRTLAGRYGGNTIDGVVLAKNQFEPWNNAAARSRMERLSPDSEEYKAYGDMVDRVWSGNVPDPTNGATHFYAPKAQAALGRAAPKWAAGEGLQIGAHTFYAPEGRVSRDGDVEGPPAAPMKLAFAGDKAVNPLMNIQQAPALSTQTVMGPGALSGKPSQTNWGNALQIAGAHLRDDTSALGLAAKLSKDPDDDNIYSTSFDPTTGTLFRLNRKTGEVSTQKTSGGTQERVDPAVLKTLNEDWGAKYGNLHYTAQEAARFADAIRDKKLDLSAYNQWVKNPIGNLMDKSDEGTALLNQYHAFRTRMANDSLRLNAGVQTEGDAQRAQQEFASGSAGYNNDAVAKQLDTFVDRAGRVMNDSAKSQLDSYLGRYGNSPALSPFAQRLQEQSRFYEERTKRFSQPQQQGGNRPPLSQFNR